MCDKGDLITCACCGYMTIYEDFQSCNVCCWECDYGQESEPDFPYGANGSITLREAQQNYMKFGAYCEEFRGEGETPTAETLRDPEWSSFPERPDPVEDAKAWRRKRQNEPMRCLCCGYETISRGGDVCRICRWKDDGGYASDAVAYTRYEWMNEGLSLYEGQQNYQRLGVFSEKYLPMKTEPRPDDKRASWWKPAPPPSDPSKFRTYVPVRKTESGGAWSSES